MLILLNYFPVYGKEKVAKEHQKIYSSGESSDSPGSFGYQRARKINSRTLQKIFQRTCKKSRKISSENWLKGQFLDKMEV